ncbi:hypothetical protein DL93DRAFT_1964134 [Clavulina sp. PMI_390]|nr:hypothetical protein DL93DRAFT_1964134 [Clavulina sp. PMI_390]
MWMAAPSRATGVFNSSSCFLTMVRVSRTQPLSPRVVATFSSMGRSTFTRRTLLLTPILLSIVGNYAGTSDTGDAQGGDGGNRVVGNPAVLGGLKHRSSTSTASGSGGGAAYSGASGSAVGGNSETDPSLVLLSMLSDNAGGGGLSQSGGALGGTAGNII